MPTVARRNVSRTMQIAENIRSSLRYGWATLPMIAAYIVVVSTTFMWFEPAPVTRYFRTVSKTDVYPGEEVYIRAGVTRSKAGCDSTVTREWLTEAGTLLVRVQFEIDSLPSGREEYERPATIPNTVTPGRLWLITNVEFRCNFVQRLFGGTHFLLPDVPFDVLPIKTGLLKQTKTSRELFAGSYP